MTKITPQKKIVISDSRKKISNLSRKKNHNKSTNIATKKKLTKIFPIQLLYSHFDFDYYIQKLNKAGFFLCNNPMEADIIASSYLKYLKPYLKLGKKYLLWTHEPYHDFTDKSLIHINKIPIHCMTVYTGDTFINNHRYFYFTKPLIRLDTENFPHFTDNSKTTVAFSTLYSESYYTGNKYGILSKRYEIINWGHKHNVLKVWGRGWGKMAEGESRKDRVRAKAEVLEKYHFNLALENACSPNYITEKIWESIASYCLPIYYGGKLSTIYKDFPKDSFIDYAKFKNAEELFKYISEMGLEEYRERMNRCIDVFNRLVEINLQQSSTSNSRFVRCQKNKNLETVDYKQNFRPFLGKLQKILT